jgi:ETFB lysine methyltransferase
MSLEPESPRQFFPETPLAALGPVIREQFLVDGRRFLIDRPDESDRTLEHPAVRAEFAVDEYLPYWTELWPAARMLAKAVLREPWPPGVDVLEVGCGLGLPGIAALARGLRVIFSDLDATALRFAADNARLNGFRDFRVLHFDWRSPPDGLRVPVVLASDLIYELRNINPLVALIQRVLLPGGVCLLTDQDRLPAYNLTDALIGEGLPYTTQVLRAGAPGGRRVRGTLYRITTRSEPDFTISSAQRYDDSMKVARDRAENRE